MIFLSKALIAKALVWSGRLAHPSTGLSFMAHTVEMDVRAFDRDGLFVPAGRSPQLSTLRRVPRSRVLSIDSLRRDVGLVGLDGRRL